jgi:hypothetical protein
MLAGKIIRKSLIKDENDDIMTKKVSVNKSFSERF